MTEDGNLIKTYLEILPSYLEEKGFTTIPILSLDHAGKLTMTAVVGSDPKTIFGLAHNIIGDRGNKEVVYAIDRTTKPGQGTLYDDVLTVYWWYGPHVGNYGFRFGIVNYKPKPDDLIEPIVWDNEFWNNIMAAEIQRSHNHVIEAIRKFKGHLGANALENMMRKNGFSEEAIVSVMNEI